MSVDSTIDNQGTVVMLAAGFSKRFGIDKRRVLFNGEYLINVCLNNYLSVFSNLRVVMRSEDRAINFQLPKEVQLVSIDTAADGMSESIKAGVRASSDSPWIMIALADMPWIKYSTLIQMSQRIALTKDKIVRLRYQHKFGLPVCFPQVLYPELLKLSGDHGARSICQQHERNTEVVEVNDAGILLDIDTPEQLKEFRRMSALNQID